MVAGGYLVFHILSMVQLHPYQYTYLNSLAGGMPAGATRYETDYWLTSYREATPAMLEHARAHAEREGVPFEKRRFDVAICGNVGPVKEFVPDNVRVVNLSRAKRADYYIGSTRWGSDALRVGG